MRRLIIFFMIVKVALFGYSYNQFLLKTQAQLFPKLILLDEKIENRLKNGKIVVAIVYDDGDYFYALHIKNLMEDLYDSRLDRYEFKIVPVDVLDILDKENRFSYLYILKMEQKKLKKLSKYAKKYKIVTFTYDKDDLKYGFLFSLDLEKEPIIYLNRNALLKDFRFSSYLFQIVRFIDV